MRKSILGVFAALVVVLAAATLAAPALNINFPWSKKMVDRDWVVTSISKKPLPADVHITLKLDSSGGISGDAGCNSYSGVFSLKSNGLEVGNINTTLMACEPEAMTLTDSYFATLHLARTAVVENGSLIMKDSTGTEILQLHPR